MGGVKYRAPYGIAVTAGINGTKEDSRSAFVAKGGGPAELG